MLNQIVEGKPAVRKPETQNDFLSQRHCGGAMTGWKRQSGGAGNHGSFWLEFACAGF